MFYLGWFSTGRDKAARDLLKVVVKSIKKGEIPHTKIVFVFSNRENGEDRESDLFFKLVGQYNIPLATFSSAKFEPRLREENLEEWRKKYDREILKKIKGVRIDLAVLAGYMLIVSPLLCNSYELINLHPAKPGGPKGTWQEVVLKLIENKEKESGVMMHLVTPELDAGPPASYCTFPIRIPFLTDNLWRLWELFHEDWMKEKLFDWIREEGLKREFPLLVETLKIFSKKEIKIINNQILDERGRVLDEGYNLTPKIEKILSEA